LDFQAFISRCALSRLGEQKQDTRAGEAEPENDGYIPEEQHFEQSYHRKTDAQIMRTLAVEDELHRGSVSLDRGGCVGLSASQNLPGFQGSNIQYMPTTTA
jgi:hypothetical protein